jgi:hypothetical protein
VVCFGDENKEAFTHKAADLAEVCLFELETNFGFAKWRQLREDLLEMGVFTEIEGDVRNAMRGGERKTRKRGR